MNLKSDGSRLKERSDQKYWVIIALLIIILFTSVIRLRLLDAPLERDEGEYAFAGQLILQGVPPYAEVYNMKMPGIYATYAAIMAIFGETPAGIHMGLLIANAATMLVLFFLAKKLFGSFIGLVSAAAFGILSIGEQIHGIFAHAEHFAILPAMCGILLLLYAVNSKRLLPIFIAALLLGLAFIIRQHTAPFIVFGLFYIIFYEFRHRPVLWGRLVAKCLLFLLGALIPFLTTCLIIWLTGVFDEFWFWTFIYAQKYVSLIPISEGIDSLKVNISRIVGGAILLWSMAGIGLVYLCWKARNLFTLLFLLFSFLAVCPGLYFRPHYFILLFPAVSLLVAIGADFFRDLFARYRLARIIPVLLITIVLSHAVYQQRKYLFTASPIMASRMTYGSSPFPESIEIARFIKDHSLEKDRIAVIGSEPQIYFYSRRHSATGYIYMYPLMEAHNFALDMQKEMISEIEESTPRLMVFVHVPASWQARTNSEKMIFDWFDEYMYKYYDKVGVVDILSDYDTVYRWGENAEKYEPRSNIWLAVYQRRN